MIAVEWKRYKKNLQNKRRKNIENKLKSEAEIENNEYRNRLKRPSKRQSARLASKRPKLNS